MGKANRIILKVCSITLFAAKSLLFLQYLWTRGLLVWISCIPSMLTGKYFTAPSSRADWLVAYIRNTTIFPSKMYGVLKKICTVASAFICEKRIKIFMYNFSASLVPAERILSWRTIYLKTHRVPYKTSTAMRWKVEELHRELKQSTGVHSCQCPKQRIQRNHIVCTLLVWARLKNLAYKMNATIYGAKREFLANYMRQQVCSPTISMIGFA